MTTLACAPVSADDAALLTATRLPENARVHRCTPERVDGVTPDSDRVRVTFLVEDQDYGWAVVSLFAAADLSGPFRLNGFPSESRYVTRTTADVTVGAVVRQSLPDAFWWQTLSALLADAASLPFPIQATVAGKALDLLTRRDAERGQAEECLLAMRDPAFAQAVARVRA